ncbi:hypothetical protein [Hyphomonas sp.]|uniref:hypothetical protein n=1 Tax=Hyphomonas sp. TaxID=87 RepID=UPI00391AB638
MPDLALFTLLHLLVFVYWLGGDLGAFYTSRFLIRPGVSADRRLMAAKIVGDVDMAPRTALILALPTGLSLAAAKGWLAMGPAVMAALWAGSLAWLALAWAIHNRHGAAPMAWRQADLMIRWLMIAGLVAAAAWSLSGAGGGDGLPLFLSLKLLALAGCTGLGLYIRAVLAPLGPALMGLTGPDAAGAEASLAATLNRARPLVVCIWALLIAAAALALFKPI